MELFPASRPLKLDARGLGKEGRKILLAIVLTLIVGLAVLGFAGFLGKTLLQERDLWKRGEAGTITSLSGEVKETRRLIPDYDYKLNVGYKDAEGKAHRGTAKFDYLIVKLDEDSDVELRYDPQSPDQFVLNWQAEGGLPRWGMFLLIAAVGLFFVGSVPFTLGKRRKRKALLQQVARDGRELWLEVLKLEKQYGSFILTYLQPAGGEQAGKKKQESLQVAPLIVQREGKDYALALSSPQVPGKCFFVYEDLGPFSFSDAERTAIAQKLAANRGN